MNPSPRLRLEYYQKQLKIAYEESPWHSFKHVMKGVKPEEAAWKPAHYKGFPWMSGNILDIAFHLGGDTSYQLSNALGDKSVTWEVLTAQFKARGGDINAAVAMAEESFSYLQKTLDTLTDTDLTRRFKTPDGKKEQSIEELLQMLLEHYFYHSGQIMYIRCLWEGERKSAKASPVL